jgi:hypothetical protein
MGARDDFRTDCTVVSGCPELAFCLGNKVVFSSKPPKNRGNSFSFNFKSLKKEI